MVKGTHQDGHNNGRRLQGEVGTVRQRGRTRPETKILVCSAAKVKLARDHRRSPMEWQQCLALLMPAAPRLHQDC